MVVRLRDIRSENQEDTTETKKIVRLKDLREQEQELANKSDPDSASTKRTADLMRTGALPPVDVRQSELFRDIENAPEPEQQQKPIRLLSRGLDYITGGTLTKAREKSASLPGRDIPVVGSALKLGDLISSSPLEDLGAAGRSVYTPGAGAGAVAGLYRGVQSAVSRAAPGLAATTGGRIAQEAIKEGVVGIPLATGQALAQTGELGESVKEGLLFGGLGGAATGGAIRAAAPVVKTGITRLKDLRAARSVETPATEAATSSWLDDAKRAAKQKDMQSVLGINQDDVINIPKIPKEIASQYDAHGMNKGYGMDLDNLVNLLDKGIDQSRSFYSARLSDETPGLSVFKGGSFIVTGAKGKPIKEGIENVIVNDAYYDAIPELQKRFPKYNFIRADEVTQKLGRIQSVPQLPEPNERGLVTSLRESDKLSPQVRQGLEQSPNRTYQPITNADTVTKANTRIAQNIDEAEAFAMGGNKRLDAEQVATGFRLIDEFQRSGNVSRAVSMAERLAEKLTEAGQAVQAASIWNRLTPEGQLLRLVRQAEKSGKKVTPADSVKFQELAAKVQEKTGAGIRSNEFNEILNRLERGENVGVADIQKLSKFLSDSKKVIKPKDSNIPIKDDLPNEFKDVRKRDKIISYLDDVEQAALARIAARKNNLNSLPLPEWKDHTIVVAAQIAKGTIKAATHVEDLVRMFGEEIRPVASQVFQSAQNMIKGVSGHVGEGDLARANEALRRVTGQVAAEKAIVQETANHVKKLIADAKAGKLDPADVQKLRDYSDEIAEMTADKPKRIVSQEERFLQSVKSLAKKIAQVENEKIPADQANREVSSLLRQVAKISDEGTPVLKREPLDNNALSDIAHDVMEKTRPNPKPTTLQEKIVEKYIKENKTVSQKDIDTLRELAKNVTRLSGGQRIDADIAMQKILNSYEKSSAWDKILAIRYMSMLLNTSTQAINAASGPIMATTGHVADVFGTMIDIAMHHALKTPRTTTLYGSNPLSFIARYLKGLKVGVKAGAQGVNPAGIQSTNEIRGLAFKSLMNPLGLAERALGAVSKGPDFATYSAVYKSEMLKQARVDAINKGIKGKANIDNHIQEFINDPPESAMLQADRIGKNTTFQRSDSTGGKVANYLNNAPSLVKPGVNAIFPFVRTPINIASTAVTMTPAGIIKGLFQLTSKSKASQREAIRTLSLGITGTGISAVGYYLFNLGIITGANDSGDKDVDAIREQAGQGKYRFNQSGLMRYLSAMLNGDGSDAAEKAAKYQEGDRAFDYNKLQPLAFPLAIGAGFGQNKDKPLVGKLASAGSDAYGSLFGMSTLKGVQDVFQPQYGGTQGEKSLGVASRIAESFFKSFSPGGLAQEARRQDPIVRKTPYNDGVVEDVTGYFKSRTPGLSQSLPANKTTLGMNKMNAPGFAGQYANPYRSEVAAYSSAAALISDLIDRTGDQSLAPSAPEKKVSGKNKKGESVSIAIPQDRYEQLQEEVGHAIIAKIMAIPQGLTDVKKAERIKEIYTTVRKKEMDKVKRELGIRIN